MLKIFEDICDLKPGFMRLTFVIYPAMLLCFISCGKTEENKMYITGEVEGLKKGTLYLQKIADTTLITLDSLKIDGDSRFEFSTSLESPEIFYLYLDKNDGNAVNDRILFFGEQGIITIYTTRDFFEPEAQISGSASHDKLEEFQKTISRFNNINLDLIEAQFNAQKENDTVKADSLQRLAGRNRKRRYLYALNFALHNADSYVSPYVVLSEAPATQLKYLDSIYNAFTPEIAGSKYGKALGALITEIKAAKPSD